MPVEIITPQVEVIDINKLIFKDLPKAPNSTPTERLIEYVGRCCYNSYDKLDSTSYIDFNKHSSKKSHRSIFEFSDIRLTITVMSNEQIDDIYEAFIFTPFVSFQKGTNLDLSSLTISITGSIRIFIETLEEMLLTGRICNWLYITIFNMCKSFKFFNEWSTINELQGYFDTIQYNTTETRWNWHDLTADKGIVRDKSRKVLVKLRIDRGLHNELVRHRPLSHMAESQRYVRYGDAGGKNPLVLCVASEDISNSVYINVLETIGEQALEYYCQLLSQGMPQQKARAVLPIGTALTHFMYADMNEWEHVLRMRASNHALPMAREVSKEIWIQMINKGLI